MKGIFSMIKISRLICTTQQSSCQRWAPPHPANASATYGQSFHETISKLLIQGMGVLRVSLGSTCHCFPKTPVCQLDTHWLHVETTYEWPKDLTPHYASLAVVCIVKRSSWQGHGCLHSTALHSWISTSSDAGEWTQPIPNIHPNWHGTGHPSKKRLPWQFEM